MNLWCRHRRKRALGLVKSSRARRRKWQARFVAVLSASLVVVLSATAAMANAPAPASSPLTSGSVVQNANGTVTVTASGTWLWPFGTESATTAGIAATVNHPCDSRTGVGWGIVWSDPNDPGIVESYFTKGKAAGLSLTVHVGSKGVNPVNTDDRVTFDPSHLCGTFIQTNVPNPGDGYDAGAWSGSHTYANAGALPQAICVITYDLGFGLPPRPHRINFDNNDNSVQWELFQNGAWDNTTMGLNCSTLPPPVAAPPTTAPPIVKTVSNASPPPAPHVAVKASTGPLAFTGFGSVGQLMAVLGVILVLVGCVLYFVDVRKAFQWLLGL
jgi:hypothetical protein